jgi:hypothetical protein
MRVLIPLPDRDFDVTEVAVPWQILRAAGHQVAFATERSGTVPAADPRLLTGVLFGQLGAAPAAKAAYAELTAAPEFTATLGWADLEVTGFDGLLLPGGHAPGMRQYLGSAVLRDQVARFWATPPGSSSAARSRSPPGAPRTTTRRPSPSPTAATCRPAGPVTPTSSAASSATCWPPGADLSPVRSGPRPGASV